jgi:hypothetical protein
MMISVTAPTNSQALSSAVSAQMMDLTYCPKSPRSPLEHDIQPFPEEPPLSLKANKIGGLHDLLTSSNTSLRRGFSSYEQRSRTKSPSPDFATAALTACSLNTMQQEYDKDTWRMYDRIQAARSVRNQNSAYSYVCEAAVEEGPYEDFGPNCSREHYPCISEEDSGDESEDSEGIFELDF